MKRIIIAVVLLTASLAAEQPDIFLHSQPDSKEMQKKAQRFFERQEQHDIYERDKQDSRRMVNCI